LPFSTKRSSRFVSGGKFTTKRHSFASSSVSVFPSSGAGQDAGGHSVDDGRFGSFTVSLLKIHFVFPFLLCTSTIYNPDFTMRRWKTKYGYFLSNGADFFCAIFC
jgi:hypothetical protein